jgi:hypothetical protein
VGFKNRPSDTPEAILKFARLFYAARSSNSEAVNFICGRTFPVSTYVIKVLNAYALRTFHPAPWASVLEHKIRPVARHPGLALPDGIVGDGNQKKTQD